MKTTTFRQILLSALAFMAGPFLLLGSQRMVELNDGLTIEIKQRPTIPEDAPRTAVPFFAEYFDTLSGVMLGCSESIGDVTVRLTSTAGDWYETEFDTSDGAVLVPASGLSGHYVLTIETADHTVYEGEFYL